jgi:hypothetical protein
MNLYIVVASIVLCAAYVACVIVRSRVNDRYCHQRDGEFKVFLEHLKNSNEAECQALLCKYDHDRLFVIEAQRAMHYKKFR